MEKKETVPQYGEPNKNEEPLLSVIILTSVASTEYNLTRCIDSVLQSTYKNKEILLVNTDIDKKLSFLVKKYADNNTVHLISAEDSFPSLVSILRIVHGDYIVFLEGECHVGIDLYRTAIKKARETNSDLVLGGFLREKDKQLYYRSNSSLVTDLNLTGDDISNFYFEARGLDYPLCYLGNKLIRRDLWQKCHDALYQFQKDTMIGFEEILISSLLFLNATRLCNTRNDYLYKDEDRITQKLSETSTKKNIAKGESVFSFLSDYIFKTINDVKQKNYLITMLMQRKWLYFYTLGEQIKKSKLSTSKKKILLEKTNAITFDKDHIIPDVELNYAKADFAEVVSNEYRGENLKKLICSKDVKVVSFDIFDTLVTRPFWYPIDIFMLLGGFVQELLGTVDVFCSFRELRVDAERRARGKSLFVDVTLDEIYAQIQEATGFSSEIIRKIKEKELELEFKYLKPRFYAKELFELAQYMDKKIIIVSDMYLPVKFLEKMLGNCGYKGWAGLFVSGEQRALKGTGDLFQIATKKVDISPENILHIGDSYDADIKGSAKAGLQSFFLPRTINILDETGESILYSYKKSFQMRSRWSQNNFIGTRILLAICANKIFDNPFILFNRDSDFNTSPEMIGYFPLGMHLFDIAKWLHEKMQEKTYTVLNFMARDGLLPLEAYKILNSFYKNPMTLNYIHLSRKTILPLMVQSTNDVYTLPRFINWSKFSPKTMLELLSFITTNNAIDNAKKICTIEGFDYEKNFTTVLDTIKFLSVFKNKFYDVKKATAYKNALKKKFCNIFEGKVATFDIGYSCRIETLLHNLFDWNITSYYIHIINDLPLFRKEKAGIEFHTFYDREMCVTGLQREVMISDIANSIYYIEQSGELIPKVGEEEYNLTAKKIILTIQQNAIGFISDIMSIFGDDMKYILTAKTHPSSVFDYFLAYPKISDKLLFSCIFASDIIGHNDVGVSFEKTWDEQIPKKESQYEFLKPRWKKTLYLVLIDRTLFKEKVKNRLRSRPILFGIFRVIYQLARKVKRFFLRR